jgi:hypothetical protein
VADEVALAGTLMELGVVKQLEDRAMPDAPLVGTVADRYWACVRAQAAHPAVRLTPVARAAASGEERARAWA